MLCTFLDQEGRFGAFVGEEGLQQLFHACNSRAWVLTVRTVAMSADSKIRLHLPVTVLLERRIITRSFWSLPSWYLHAVAVGDSVAANASQSDSSVKTGSTDKGDLFAWTGFKVTLYKDACERYWHALIGDKPLVYVVCRDDADDPDESGVTISPVIVTIDYDEATACAETDSLVLSAPIPPELYRYMEAFVLEHYKPAPFKKRKRRNWSEEPGSGSLKTGKGINRS